MTEGTATGSDPVAVVAFGDIHQSTTQGHECAATRARSGVATCDNPLRSHAAPSTTTSPRPRATLGCARERRRYVSRTYKDRPEGRANSRRGSRTSFVHGRESDGFRCRHCGQHAGPARFGGRHRNHCSYCLHSLHVDGTTPGDRASDCRSRMAPVGVFARRNGEQAIVHRCLGCGFERHCRVAADDDFGAVMRLPMVEARLNKRSLRSHEMTA